MPELLEVEAYRLLAERVVGNRIESVETPDGWFLKHTTATAVRDALIGARVASTGRIGKLLLVHLEPGRPVLGLRFGMTGRLLIDGEGPIDRLEYAPGRDNPGWDRLGLRLDDGRHLRVTDPRRLGGVELDPDTTKMGVDATKLTRSQLRDVLSGSRAQLKARLLDQARIAGLGNLLVDEILWRSDLDPSREAASLDEEEIARLATRIRSTVALLGRRGGSNKGDLQEHRHRDGRCPRDGATLARLSVGGRTTYWCPTHQV
ncbi:MAG: hypothetical protein KDB09_12495 [Acidimicrobiales bacterium]|nr:hypothetical protein [Acidimicrobiales bacterium]